MTTGAQWVCCRLVTLQREVEINNAESVCLQAFDIEISCSWLRYQPQNALSQWYTQGCRHPSVAGWRLPAGTGA